MQSSPALLFLAAGLMMTSGCGRAFDVSPADRVSYLRELVRARTVLRDSVPIDACSVQRFMTGMPTWRDSLSARELAMIVESSRCAGEPVPTRGRFVLTRWYRSWSGEYIIRGSTYPWEQNYRFTDGIFAGREQLGDRETSSGIAEPGPGRAPTPPRIITAAPWQRRDTVRQAGTVGDSIGTRRDSTADTSRVMADTARPSGDSTFQRR